MKNLLSFFILLFLASACAPTLNYIPRQTEIVGFDFSEYSKKGFLITPGEYGENYETVGLLTFSIYPEAKKIDVIIKKDGKDVTIKKWKLAKVDPSEAIELAYQEATKRDANAITHFKINFDSKIYSDGMGTVTITGIQVSGLLIKRK